jgi:2-iminobutanoate/2-iminopropanoate deaminase
MGIDEDIRHPLKSRPKNARQHVTAGPYSPVLEVDARRLVVLSGQVAVDLEGHVVGATIEEQTAATLRNCADHLATAGCTLADVFKVNIYLTDLAHWSRFNAVYEQQMEEPLPARTAVQAVLLPGFLVEIEMWAVKAKE